MTPSTQGSRLPAWAAKKRGILREARPLRQILRSYGLNTVCESARCPNIGECFSRPTATFMIAGTTCTRRCGFCAVDTGRPAPLDPEEPLRLARATASLGLKHVVVTAVARDDLRDGGAGHFAATIRALRAEAPTAIVEVLTPDFKGDEAALAVVLREMPDVFNHNLETVRRLSPSVRPQASYERSLAVLARAKELAPDVLTKSGLMLGLGETGDELATAFSDLRAAGCDLLTIGQYLQPTREHLAVAEYVSPATFDEYGTLARTLGFRHVASGPFVRSSYHAEETFVAA